MAGADRAKQAAGQVGSKFRQVSGVAGARAGGIAQSMTQSKAASGRIGKYVLSKNTAGRFHFTLHATNGQIIATSETYETRAAALNGINSVRRNAVQARLVEDTTSDSS